MNHTSWHYCVHLYWHACVLILALQHVTYLVELTLWLINCHVYGFMVMGGRISTTGTLGEGQPSGSTLQCVSGRLRESLDKLLQASLAPSSRAHYERAWKKLVNFNVLLGLPNRLPVSVPMVLLFIAHLYVSGSAPASIVSTVLAVFISTISMVSMTRLIALWNLSCWQELVIWERSLMSACLSHSLYSVA